MKNLYVKLFSFVLQDSQWRELLESLHTLNIPDPGVPVHLSVVMYCKTRCYITINLLYKANYISLSLAFVFHSA